MKYGIQAIKSHVVVVVVVVIAASGTRIMGLGPRCGPVVKYLTCCVDK